MPGEPKPIGEIVKELGRKYRGLAEKQGVDWEKAKTVPIRARCPNCTEPLEALGRDVIEIFIKKAIDTGKSIYSSTLSIFGKKKRFKLASDYEMGAGRKTYQVKRISYEYFCPSCSSVYPEQVVLKTVETAEEREETPEGAPF